jgi:hypothetical protein
VSRDIDRQLYLHRSPQNPFVDGFLNAGGILQAPPAINFPPVRQLNKDNNPALGNNYPTNGIIIHRYLNENSSPIQNVSRLKRKKPAKKTVEIQKFNSYASDVSPTLKMAQGTQGEDLQNVIQVKKETSCKCKKSNCLKLYCECFAAKTICKSCSCCDCKNNEDNKQQRESEIKKIEEKTREAFTQKIVMAVAARPNVVCSDSGLGSNEGSMANVYQHTRGCHCKKSGCLKKYCECYQSGAHCTDKCKCNDCKNNGSNNPEWEFKEDSRPGFDDMGSSSSYNNLQIAGAKSEKRKIRKSKKSKTNSHN